MPMTFHQGRGGLQHPGPAFDCIACQLHVGAPGGPIEPTAMVTCGLPGCGARGPRGESDGRATAPLGWFEVEVSDGRATTIVFACPTAGHATAVATGRVKAAQSLGGGLGVPLIG